MYNRLNVKFFSFQRKISEKDAKKIQTLASLFKIDSIMMVATKRPGRPKGSTNKSKLKPAAKVTTLLEPETIEENFAAEETSYFSRSDMDNKRLKRTRDESELEPSDGVTLEKSDRREILGVDESSTKVGPQTSIQVPTYIISQTKYSDQMFHQFQNPVQMPSTSNSQERIKVGPLLSQNSSSVPCYVVSSSKYQDPDIPTIYQATSLTSNSQSTSFSVQNSDVKIASEIPLNDFTKNKFD